MSIEALLISLAVFMLAIFVGYLTITRVPTDVAHAVDVRIQRHFGNRDRRCNHRRRIGWRVARRDLRSGGSDARDHQRGRRLSRY